MLFAGLFNMTHVCSLAGLCPQRLRNAKPYVPVWDIHHILCLSGETVAGTLSLRLQQLDVRCETKTRDNASLPPSCYCAHTSATWACVMRSVWLPADTTLQDVQSPLDLTHTNAGRSAKLCLSLASAGMQVFVNVVVSVQYQVGTEPSHASLLCCFLAAMSPEDICTPVMPPAPHWSACR